MHAIQRHDEIADAQHDVRNDGFARSGVDLFEETRLEECKLLEPD